MIRIFLTLFILFISNLTFAYEEICLSGETTTYKFASGASLEVSLPSTEFNSQFSACNYALSVYQSVKDSNNVAYYLETRFLGVQDMGTGINACHISFRKNEPYSQFEHDYITLEKVTQEKDCSCPTGQTRDFNGQCVQRCPNGSTWNGQKCVLTSCPEGQHLEGSRCLDDEQPVEQCPDGYYWGEDNTCHKYSQCAPDEEFKDGQCQKKQQCRPGECPEPEEPDVCDPNSKFHFICEWYNDWNNWWNDYNLNEEESHNQRQQIVSTIDELRTQDSEFYDYIRTWLENSNGSPSSEFPIIEFPQFCEWSNNLCDFYLDWRDWREDYNRNEQQAQIDRKQIIENQDRDFQQNKEFYNDVRDFMDEQKDQNNNPLEPENQQYDIKENDNVDLTTNNYIQSASACPIDRNIPLSMGGYTTNIVISYQALCSAATMFKPFVILMSFIAGIFIITNTGRRAETGD